MDDQAHEHCATTTSPGTPPPRAPPPPEVECTPTSNDVAGQQVTTPRQTRSTDPSRLSSPPQRLAAVPEREFALNVVLAQKRGPYDPLADPHLGPYWARRSILDDLAEQHRKREQRARQKEKEYADTQRKRFLEHKAKEVAQLSARRSADRQGGGGSQAGTPRITGPSPHARGKRQNSGSPPSTTTTVTPKKGESQPTLNPSPQHENRSIDHSNTNDGNTDMPPTNPATVVP